MSQSRDTVDTTIWGRSLFVHFVMQYFSVNFHFLNNDKSFNKDFFTTDIIDYRLPFDELKLTFHWFFQSAPYIIFQNVYLHVYKDLVISAH